MRSFLNYKYQPVLNESESEEQARRAKLEMLLNYCYDNFVRIGESESFADFPEPVEILVNEIKPIDICRWLKDIAYHNSDPSPSDRPVYARSSTLLCHKRNVSFYMPLADVPWDVTANNGRGKGNPTRSRLVNKTIDKVVQHEIKGNGAPARDARALEFEEFKEVVRVARTKVLKRSKYIYKYMHPALLLTQFQLTARTDDVVLFDVDELRRNKWNLLDIKLCASKNMYKREDSFWQTITGSMDSTLCCIIALAAYVGALKENELKKHDDRVIEKSISFKEPALPGFFRFTLKNRCTKSSLSRRLRFICKNTLDLPGRTSTHSVRKGSCQEMQMNNCTREVSEQRGRWVQANTRKAANVYHKEFMRRGDLEAATVLAGPQGTCRYTSNATIEIAHNLLLAAADLLLGVELVLCSAAVWAYHNDDAKSLLPEQLVDRIKNYESIHGPLEAAREKTILVHHGKESKIIPDDGTVEVTSASHNEDVSKVYTEFKLFKRKYEADEKVREKRHKVVMNKLKTIHESYRGIATYTPRARKTTGSALLPKFSSLHQLWEAFQYGRDGNKAMIEFSKTEIRGVKHKWCLYKKGIDAIKFLVAKGIEPAVACDRLMEVYRFDFIGKSDFLRNISGDLKHNNLRKYFDQYNSL
mgnify:FL=1